MNPVTPLAFGASVLALVVAILALRGSNRARLEGLPLPMRRARLHFAVLALAWLTALLALGLALLLDVDAQRLLLVALAGHAALLVLSLGYAAALYAPAAAGTEAA